MHNSLETVRVQLAGGAADTKRQPGTHLLRRDKKKFQLLGVARAVIALPNNSS